MNIISGISKWPNAPFLNWGEDGQEMSETSSIIARTRLVCKKLDVSLKLEDTVMVISTNELEKKTDSAVGIGHYLTQKVVRPRMFKRLLEKEKHEATFATLENNLISNGILTDAKTTKSNAFFRFTVAARADLLPTPANVEQWYQRPKLPCLRCGGDVQPTLAHILNGFQGNFAEMTRRHNKVVKIIRRAIVENMVGMIHSTIGENVTIQEDGLSDAVQSLRQDLNFIVSLMWQSLRC
jgi:hypothetical protein